jgi:putative nucleotidyltransferase with HDIG domain
MKIIPLPGRVVVRPRLWSLVRRWRRWLWGAALTAFLTALFASPMVPDRVPLRVGEVADRDIRARESAQYYSEIETAAAREAAAQRVPLQYDDDTRAANDAFQALIGIFNIIGAAREADTGAPMAKRVATTLKALGPDTRLTAPSIETALRAPKTDFEHIRMRAEVLLNKAMSADIRNDAASLREARRKIAESAAVSGLEPGAARLVTEAVQSVVRPNRVYSEVRTEAARAEARRSTPPVTRTVVDNEIIVSRGEIITPRHVEAFKALGLQHAVLDLRRLAGLYLFLGLVVLAVSVFLRLYQPDVYNDPKQVLVLVSLVAASAAGLKIGHSWLGVQMSPSQTGFLTALWIAVPAMLVSTFVSGRTALLTCAVLAVTAGVVLELEPRFIALAVISALAGICGVARIRDRTDLLRIAAAVSTANLVLAWVLGLIFGDGRAELLTGTLWALGTGVMSAMLFWLGVATLERVFGLVTHVGLLELCDLNRDLLRRLQWEAPGTFHHSLGVAVLAEAGAEAIGADALLCRVCAYYHDIGKMRRPHYFTENQMVENIHEKLAPTLSTIAITSHVKEGLELARQHRLPPVVSDAIVQHHGTSLVSFFYHQATEGVERSDALEQQFRYEGPKPRSKEMAILMLADGAEAVSRTLDKPTPARIEQAIDAIIESRLADGQMDECDLTFRDIGLIRSAFVRVLSSMLHTRIEYPAAPGAESPARTNGSNGQKNSPATPAATKTAGAG